MIPNIIVHGGWFKDHFFIWGEEQASSSSGRIVRFEYPFLYSPFELRLALFRHDPHSFYGSFLQHGQAVLEVPLAERAFHSPAGTTTIYQAEPSMKSFRFPVEGIMLSADELFDYGSFLSKLGSSSSDEWVLADDFHFWLHFFLYIRQSIRNGAFSPSAQGTWVLNNPHWKAWAEAMPEVCLALTENAPLIQTTEEEPVHEQLQAICEHLTDKWIRRLLQTDKGKDRFLSYVQSLHPSVKRTLEQMGPYGEGPTEETHSEKVDRDHFLEAVGVKPQAPFQCAFVLKEPITGKTDWTLSLCVVDKVNPSIIVEMEELSQGQHPWRMNPVPLLKERLPAVTDRLPLLQSIKLSSPVIKLSNEEAYHLFTTYDEYLKELGFRLIVPRWLTQRRPLKVKLKMDAHALHSEVEPLLNWQSVASFQYELAIGDNRVSLEEFQTFVDENRPFLQLNGEWIAWDPSLAKKLRAYLNKLEHGQTTYLDAWRLEQSEEGSFQEAVEWELEWSAEIEQKIKQLFQQNVPLRPAPASLQATLRPYQEEGASWLIHLRETGFGGCLADDMGLGKTVQTISYILYVLEHGQQNKKPFLLFCPTSLITNWVHECKTFAPSLNVYVHHGQQRHQENETAWREADIVISSYSLAYKDLDQWKDIEWNGLILDEAQQIKNVDTKQRQAVKSIRAAHRIALTGTPIENRLKELWSIMDVLNPSYLKSLTHFTRTFIKPIEREKDEARLQELQQLIQPLLLRRKKSDEALALQLPEKREHVHRVSLSVEQAALYQAVVDNMVHQLGDVTHMERRALILKTLTKLKQICNHPAHFLKDKNVDAHQSEKWELLLTLSEQIMDRQEKMLIFTQFKEMGHLMQDAFQSQIGTPIPFLHGSLSRQQRQEAVERFQNDRELPIFILSLKAGGVGLNLTAANHVIHYDRWWNPAVENQATDRAYRIGQTADVTVHKLMTEGTLEERIHQMLESKQALAEQILTAGENQLTELTDDELLALIRL
ncbi:DEAD/DEAH box helicase [Halalkalibacterium halodurans]|uniref:DEAD/DEAH box helicase n=1 Tax=Halalkalibacterium halodurans TaxID=86665 RepID=UPI002E1F84D2|nr:DEAD/DEAH box helicase [Halalkalibacterium halodurans]